MKYIKFTFLAFLLISCAFVAVYFLLQPAKLELISERGIPVPPDAEVIEFKSGGLFAQFLFAKIKSTPESIQRYRERLPEPIQLNTADGIQIVKTYPEFDLKSASEADGKRDQQFRIKHQFNNGYLPWWTIAKIKNGTYHQADNQDATGWEVFIDDDKSEIFIYWHYS